MYGFKFCSHTHHRFNNKHSSFTLRRCMSNYLNKLKAQVIWGTPLSIAIMKDRTIIQKIKDLLRFTLKTESPCLIKSFVDKSHLHHKLHILHQNNNRQSLYQHSKLQRKQIKKNKNLNTWNANIILVCKGCNFLKP